MKTKDLKKYLTSTVEPAAVHLGMFAMAAATIFGVTEMSRQPVRDIAVNPVAAAFRAPREHEIGRLTPDYGEVLKHTATSSS